MIPASTPARTHLITAALRFVRAVWGMPGVQRIALLGSIATQKPNPKDVDLLVTVADGADLAPLATEARRLKGNAQSANLGADVFLADPAGRYLGRACGWKQCMPGIRRSCDALHCGRRPYLHDDLKAIRLDGALVAAPPIELRPQIVTRVPVPPDVAHGLIAPLGGDAAPVAAPAPLLHRPGTPELPSSERKGAVNAMPNRRQWVYAPNSGGSKIPDAVKRRTEERLRRYAEQHFAGRFTRLDIRFRGQFCYIDAFVEPANPPNWPPADWPETREQYLERMRNAPIHLCRLRYFGDENGWTFAFYAYSSEKYELSILPSGEFSGPPEDAFDAAFNAYFS